MLLNTSPPPNEEELKSKAIEDMKYTLNLFQCGEHHLLQSHLTENPYYSLQEMAADFETMRNDDLRSIKVYLEGCSDEKACRLRRDMADSRGEQTLHGDTECII